jgi:hypothetical protein
MLGGFRLSDLNKNVKLDEYFPIDSHVAETSRAVTAALKAKWMVEVSEDEASEHIFIANKKKSKLPKEEKRRSVGRNGCATPDFKQVDEIQDKRQKENNSNVRVATPNIKEVNKNLESRQVRNQKEQDEEKVSVPNVPEVEKKIKSRKEDTIGTGDKVIESPALSKQAAKAESDDEGMTTVKSLSKDDNDEFEDLREQIEGDSDPKIKRRKKMVEEPTE